MISTLIDGPVMAEVFCKEREAYAWSRQALEHVTPDELELRMLACEHNARCTPGMLSIVEPQGRPPGGPLSGWRSLVGGSAGRGCLGGAPGRGEALAQGEGGGGG
jgi:hypothetical protein